MSTRHTSALRQVLFTGSLLLLAGCTATGGGCSPFDAHGGTTTTVPDGGTSTTAPGGDTTTTTPDDETTTTTEATGSTTTVPDDPGPALTAIADVDVEDCLTPATDDLMVAEVELVACDEPHQAEVFAQFTLDRDALPGSGTEYPGANELTWYADDACRERFGDYTGQSYWTSAFDLRSVSPSFSTWDQGDRSITCLIVNGDGTALTASAGQR
ncbi:MAG: septum formation family protein [Microthrixaceae bacterium]